jgi:hypothetical protein
MNIFQITDAGWRDIESSLREEGATAKPVVCRTPCRPDSDQHFPHLTSYGRRHVERLLAQHRAAARQP